MPVPLAQPDDVAAVWRDLADGEVIRVATLINQASAQLRAVVPFSIDARIALYATDPTDRTALDPVLVAGVVARIVKRVLVNPEGLQSSTRTVGPYSESRTHGARGEGSGDIVVTAADVADLMPRALPSPVRTLEAGLSDRMLGYRRPRVISVTQLGEPLVDGNLP